MILYWNLLAVAQQSALARKFQPAPKALQKAQLRAQEKKAQQEQLPARKQLKRQLDQQVRKVADDYLNQIAQDSAQAQREQAEQLGERHLQQQQQSRDKLRVCIAAAAGLHALAYFSGCERGCRVG